MFLLWNSVKSALVFASAVVEQSADVCGDCRTSFSLLMSQSPRPGPVTLLQSAGKSWLVQLFLFFFFFAGARCIHQQKSWDMFQMHVLYTPNYVRHIRLYTVKYVHVKLQQHDQQSSIYPCRPNNQVRHYKLILFKPKELYLSYLRSFQRYEPQNSTHPHIQPNPRTWTIK